MPSAIHAIWWDDSLGPFLGRSYPESESLTAEEALSVFMGHGVNQEAKIGYTNLSKGLVVSVMESPNCIAVVLDNDEDVHLIERCLLRLATEIDFNTSAWDSEIKKSYLRLVELVKAASVDELLAKPEVKRMLDDLRSKRLPSLIPKHLMKGHARYPEASKYIVAEDEEVARVLKDLESAGLLLPKTYGRRLECRQCGSSEVSLGLRCPRCSSEELYTVYAIFCPSCGDRTQVVIPDDLVEVTCQHCKTRVKVSELTVLDVEVLCAACGAKTVDPNLFLQCDVCGRHLTNVDILAGTGLAYYSPEEP